MRITFVAYDTKDSCGGPFAWAPVFMEQMQERGGQIHALILTLGDLERSQIADRCNLLGIPYTVLDTKNAPTLDDQVEWILDQWKNNPTELFVANLVLPALIAGRWIKHAGAKSIGILHSNPEHDPFYRDFVRVFLSESSPYQLSGCIAVSKHIADIVSDHKNRGTVLEVIPCGAEKLSESAVFCDKPFRIMYCGRLEQEAKRIRDVVRSMQLLTHNFEKIHCSIFGSGSEEQWIKTAITGNERIVLKGKVSPWEIQAEMRQHQVILLLSDYEGLPIALIEGMLSGLVPVCFDEPSGAREVIIDGHNGKLVTDREGSVLKAIGTLLNQSNWEEMSKNAMTTAIERYSYGVVMKKWWEFLSDMHPAAEIDLAQLPSSIELFGTLPVEAFSGYHHCRIPERLRQPSPRRSLRTIVRRLVQRLMR